MKKAMIGYQIYSAREDAEKDRGLRSAQGNGL